MSNTQLIQALEDYVKHRKNRDYFPEFTLFGYSENTKIAAVSKLLQRLQGESSDPFTDAERMALLDGRVGKIVQDSKIDVIQMTTFIAEVWCASCDYDGSIMHGLRAANEVSNLAPYCVKAHAQRRQQLIEHFKASVRGANKTRIYVGSARQCHASDYKGDEANSNGSIFVAYPQFCELLSKATKKEVTLSKLLLADPPAEESCIFARQEGRAWEEPYVGDKKNGIDEHEKQIRQDNVKAMKNLFGSELNKENYDFYLKIYIVLTQMWDAHYKDPQAKIHFDFFDDRDDILNFVEAYLQSNARLIPQNMNLRLRKFKAFNTDRRIGKFFIFPNRPLFEKTVTLKSSFAEDDKRKPLPTPGNVVARPKKQADDEKAADPSKKYCASLDYDNCVMHVVEAEDENAAGLKALLVAHFTDKVDTHEKTELYVGSARQDHVMDDKSNSQNKNGSIFDAYPKFCELLKRNTQNPDAVTFSTLLVADPVVTDRGLFAREEGCVWGKSRALDQRQKVYAEEDRLLAYNDERMRKFFGDETLNKVEHQFYLKTCTIITQMWNAHYKDPQAEIVFDFFDDKQNILQFVYEYLKNNPWLIPPKLIFNAKQFEACKGNRQDGWFFANTLEIQEIGSIASPFKNNDLIEAKVNACIALSNYKRMRADVDFFPRFTLFGYSEDDKLAVVDKLLRCLSGSESITFTKEEIGALRNGNLGKNVKSHAILQPIVKAPSSSAKALRFP